MTTHVTARIEVSVETGRDATAIARAVKAFAATLGMLGEAGFAIRILAEPRVVDRETPAPELPLDEPASIGGTDPSPDDDPLAIPASLDRRALRQIDEAAE